MSPFPAALKRPIESFSRPWLGVVSIIVIATVLLATVVYSGLGVGRTRYQGEFAQAAQIRSGAVVTIAGVKVGTVERVKLAGDHVVVGFNVERGIPLGADTRAAIKLTTILGSRYLELSPAGTGALTNRRITLAHTEVPYDLQRTLAGATRTLGPVDADRFVDSLNTLNANLGGVAQELPQSLKNLQAMADIIADRRDQLGTLLTNTETLTTMLRTQRANLGALVLQGRDVLREIATRRAAVQQLFASATLLIDRAHGILGDEAGVNQMIGDFGEFMKMTADHDALLRSFLQSTPVALRNFTNATGSGNAVDVFLPAGVFVDSWMCALSGRARQFNLVEYFKDCE
ncbi:MlaD family protein [Mycolicibacter sp. MYC123]|uniref:MlaD family protein n=2 Tax=Mycolicibacter TaxID=1073531 RepID=A0ABU5YGE0_9MYCO|nr:MULTISPECIES: MlaD family protein [unclassified Mycolicibacter]MEB3048930.1 MlaD family protein [Mycolicibacter sp. MYC123]MEB3062148.1 MlaD family protein [Mycolicibacter sp. MYC101]MEB3070357.1 MlaD family protein [Mycolicibacter sp. MYC017]